LEIIEKLQKITENNITEILVLKCIPDLSVIESNIELNGWHNGETTLTHITTVLKNYLETQSANPSFEAEFNSRIGLQNRFTLIRLAILLHDIGKLETRVINGLNTMFPGHEIASGKIAENILNNFSDIDTNDIKYVLFLITNHGNAHKVLNERRVAGDNADIFTKDFGDYAKDIALMIYCDTLNSYLQVTNKEEYNYRIDFLKDFLSLI
jgi:CRISPR/Cas system-associated endonuclease Cas3-HD